MIEPWYTPWSGLVYKKLHHEAFDPDVKYWDFPSSGPLSGANGALPWIVFERDKKIFSDKFPYYEILKIQKIMPFSYLLSGGFSYKSFLPESCYNVTRKLEKYLGIESICAMFSYIHIYKKFNI